MGWLAPTQRIVQCRLGGSHIGFSWRTSHLTSKKRLERPPQIGRNQVSPTNGGERAKKEQTAQELSPVSTKRLISISEKCAAVTLRPAHCFPRHRDHYKSGMSAYMMILATLLSLGGAQQVFKGAMFGVPHIQMVQTLAQPTVLGIMELQNGIAKNKKITMVKGGLGDMWNFFVSILTAITVAISSVACASPCDGVDNGLNKERAVDLAPVIAKQLHVARVEVLKSFRMDNWSIIYVDTHVSDETFLFYARDPLTSQYINEWSGAATRYEGQIIKDWAIKNVPGIPIQLATCFAWYVTKSDDL